MKAQLRITGPNLNREVVLDPSGAELTLGRDPSADVTLIDPQKHISRKHLTLRQSADGVELRIISELNGIETSRGPAQPGQRTTLLDGDHFTLGPYRIDVEWAPGETPPASVAAAAAAAAFGADDPFAALLGPAVMPSGDDPFARPEFRPPPAAAVSSVDPFQQLAGIGAAGSPANVAAAGPLGSFLAPRRAGSAGSQDVLASFGAEGPTALATGGEALDAWLSGASPAAAFPMAPVHAGGPLDSFLGRGNAPLPRELSPEHVHGIHLPMSVRGGAAPQPVPPPAGPAPATAALPAPPATTDDMWADLLKGSSPPATVEPTQRREQTTLLGPGGTLAAPAASAYDASGADALDISFGDDPFDDWADTASLPLGSAAPGADPPTTISRTPRPGPGHGPPDAAAAAVAAPAQDGFEAVGAAWPAFAQGLGLPATHSADAQVARRAGVMVRVLIEGVAELLGARADLKRELRAEDRTLLSGRDNNPLKAGLSANDLVQYLFAPPMGAAYLPADRAVRESIAELRVHEHATIAASRAAVEGALRDFEPGRLRKQLAPARPGMFQVLDNARLWEAYQAHYENQALHMADWLEAVFARHFMPTYGRETERLKQARTGATPDDPAD